MRESDSSPSATLDPRVLVRDQQSAHSEGHRQDHDRPIVAAARRAEETGDFSEIRELADWLLVSAEKRWAPYGAQDRAYREYEAKSWWRKFFSRRPDAMTYGRFNAADNLALARALKAAVAEGNVKAFTDRR